MECLFWFVCSVKVKAPSQTNKLKTKPLLGRSTNIGSASTELILAM